MRLVAISLAAAAVAAIAAPASAQTADPRDVRCLLAMSAVASNPEYRQLALTGLYYFTGRVKAQQPLFSFTADLPQEARKMTRADFTAEARRCGAVMADIAAQLKQAETALAGFQPKN